MSTLSAWHETKRLLDSGEADGQRAYLEAVLVGLQPAALLEYLEANCRSFDSERYDDEDRADTTDVREFLAGLDELRQPQYRDDETRAEMQREVSKTLTAIRRLNWTGEHTYGDALDDAQTVLRHVLAGQKSWPALERFRCPSVRLKKFSGMQVRCMSQLPHDGAHFWTDVDLQGEMRNSVSWLDTASVNPPKNYDGPVKLCGERSGSGDGALTCDRIAGHTGPHGDSRADNGWYSPKQLPVQLTDAQLDKLGTEVFGPESSSRCGSSVEYSDASKSVTLYCKWGEGHDGEHQAPTGEYWSTGFRVQGRVIGNPDPINRPPISDLDAEELAGQPVRSNEESPWI